MSEPLPSCPYDKRGRHELNVIIPESDTNPILLFCSHCGMTERQPIQLPAPLDDLPADAIYRIAKGEA